MLRDICGGAHLGTMRSWIQWHAANGSEVIWGSEDYVNLKPLTAGDLDRLAQDIRNAVLAEAKVDITPAKGKQFVVFADKGKAFQDAATWQEVWAVLANVVSSGVTVYYRKNGHLETALYGDIYEVTKQVLGIIRAEVEDPTL